MTQDQFIKNLKQLKQIKPNQNWVVFNKTQILGQEEKTFENFFSVLWRKPAYATIVAVILLAIGIAGFLLVETPEKVVVYQPKELVEPAVEKEIILALEGLQKEINELTEGLRKIEEPQKVLEARNVIVPTIEATRKLVVEVEKLEQEIEDKQDKILTVKTRVDGLENTLDERLAIITSRLIQDLKTKTLTDIQQEILEKAELAYQDGDYAGALIDAMHVRQNIERIKQLSR